MGRARLKAEVGGGFSEGGSGKHGEGKGIRMAKEPEKDSYSAGRWLAENWRRMVLGQGVIGVLFPEAGV